MPHDTPSPQEDTFDRIALDLRELREAAGPVSYAEIVRRITDLRIRRGVHAAGAVPPRSTVYNAFRTGRARMDTGLLREIVLALGSSEEEADAWVLRCRTARRTAASAQRNEDAAGAEMQPLPAVHPRSVVMPRSGVMPRSTVLSQPHTRALPPPALLLLLVALVVVNHASHWFLAAPLDLPVYLDMIGTAVASIAFGPWPGVAVAICTGLTGPLFEDGILAFTVVNITGALVWGYGIRRFRLGRDILGFFFLNLLVAAACSLVATPILVVLRGGAYGTVGRIAESLQDAGMPFIAATFASNISTSILDKLLTGFVALAVFAALHRRLQVPATHMPLVEDLTRLRTSTG